MRITDADIGLSLNLKMKQVHLKLLLCLLLATGATGAAATTGAVNQNFGGPLTMGQSSMSAWGGFSGMGAFQQQPTAAQLASGFGQGGAGSPFAGGVGQGGFGQGGFGQGGFGQGGFGQGGFGQGGFGQGGFSQGGFGQGGFGQGGAAQPAAASERVTGSEVTSGTTQQQSSYAAVPADSRSASSSACYNIIDSSFPSFSHYCSVLPQTTFSLPNFFGLTTKKDTSDLLNDLREVLDSQCVRDIRMFTCPLLFPPCDSETILPCASFCRAVKNRCNAFDLSAISCDKLPEKSDFCPTFVESSRSIGGASLQGRSSSYNDYGSQTRFANDYPSTSALTRSSSSSYGGASNDLLKPRNSGYGGSSIDSGAERINTIVTVKQAPRGYSDSYGGDSSARNRDWTVEESSGSSYSGSGASRSAPVLIKSSGSGYGSNSASFQQDNLSGGGYGSSNNARSAPLLIKSSGSGYGSNSASLQQDNLSGGGYGSSDNARSAPILIKSSGSGYGSNSASLQQDNLSGGGYGSSNNARSTILVKNKDFGGDSSYGSNARSNVPSSFVHISKSVAPILFDNTDSYGGSARSAGSAYGSAIKSAGSSGYDSGVRSNVPTVIKTVVKTAAPTAYGNGGGYGGASFERAVKSVDSGYGSGARSIQAKSFGNTFKSSGSGSYGNAARSTGSGSYGNGGSYGSSYGAQPTGEPYGIQSTGEYTTYQEEKLDLSRCGPVITENPCTINGPQYYAIPGYPSCYIQCSLERMFVKPCPNYLVWNSRVNACDWPTVAEAPLSNDNSYGSSSYSTSSRSSDSGSSYSYGRKKRSTTERKKRMFPGLFSDPINFEVPLGPPVPGLIPLPGFPGPIGIPGPLIPPPFFGPGIPPIPPPFVPPFGPIPPPIMPPFIPPVAPFPPPMIPPPFLPVPPPIAPAFPIPPAIIPPIAPIPPPILPPPLPPFLPPVVPPLPIPLGGPLLPPLPMSIPATFIPGPPPIFGNPFFGGGFGGGFGGPFGDPFLGGPLGLPFGPFGGPFGALGPFGVEPFFDDPFDFDFGFGGGFPFGDEFYGGHPGPFFEPFPFPAGYDIYGDFGGKYDHKKGGSRKYDHGDSYGKGYGHSKKKGDYGNSYSSYGDRGYGKQSDYKKSGNFKGHNYGSSKGYSSKNNRHGYSSNKGYDNKGYDYKSYGDNERYYRKRRNYGLNIDQDASISSQNQERFVPQQFATETKPMEVSSYGSINQQQMRLLPQTTQQEPSRRPTESFNHLSLCAGKSTKSNVAHPSDASKYISCLNEETYEVMDCPSGLIYNVAADQCEKVKNTESICEREQPCMNGGQCYQTSPSSYKCTCRGSWTGERCETPISSCASNPCGEGNECHTLHAGDYKQDYVCVCNGRQSYGLSCERNTVPNPCMSPSQDREQYYPFAYSAHAYVQCNGDILYVRPCSGGLFWNQESKICDREETSPARPAQEQSSSYQTGYTAEEPKVNLPKPAVNVLDQSVDKQQGYRYRNYNPHVVSSEQSRSFNQINSRIAPSSSNMFMRDQQTERPTARPTAPMPPRSMFRFFQSPAIRMMNAAKAQSSAYRR